MIVTFNVMIYRYLYGGDNQLFSSNTVLKDQNCLLFRRLSHPLPLPVSFNILHYEQMIDHLATYNTIQYLFCHIQHLQMEKMKKIDERK